MSLPFLLLHIFFLSFLTNLTVLGSRGCDSLPSPTGQLIAWWQGTFPRGRVLSPFEPRKGLSRNLPYKGDHLILVMAKLFQPEADDTLPERSPHSVCSKGVATKEKALRQPGSAAAVIVLCLRLLSLRV